MNRLQQHIKAFFLALQFLTRLPSPNFVEVNDTELARSSLYFAWVGLLIGGLLFGFVQVFRLTEFSIELQAGLVLVFWVWLTGALHLDGAADMADAWLGAKHNREKALEIMKDSRIGVGGGAILVLILLIKWLALVSLLNSDNFANLIWLLFIPPMARVMAMALMLTVNYARTDGIAASMISSEMRPFHWFWLIAAIVALSLFAWLMVVAVVIAFLLMRQASKRLTGGMTGDTAGAMIEWIELVMLLVLAAGFIQNFA